MVQCVQPVSLIITKLYRSYSAFPVSKVVNCKTFERALKLAKSLLFVLQNHDVASMIPNELMILIHFESAYLHVFFDVPNDNRTSLKLVNYDGDLDLSRSTINEPNFCIFLVF